MQCLTSCTYGVLVKRTEYLMSEVMCRVGFEDNFRALNKREYLVIIRDIFCLILRKSIHCDHSSEPSQQDSSDEGS